jgi:hypothetical protein
MPWFIPALAATVTAAVARKIVARYWHGVYGQHAPADPPGLRTVARFSADDSHDVLLLLAAELARDIEGVFEVTKDAIRVRTDDDACVDIVRLARRPDASHTVELTRAWTGVYLGEQTRRVLHRMHRVLARVTREHAWYARQDRDLVDAYPIPYDEQSVANTK